jgi:hypothetical protein
MPLTKKQSGWYWGAQGPFDTKAKALAVSCAAYASGYKAHSNDVITYRIDENGWKPSASLLRKFEKA